MVFDGYRGAFSIAQFLIYHYVYTPYSPFGSLNIKSSGQTKYVQNCCHGSLVVSHSQSNRSYSRRTLVPGCSTIYVPPRAIHNKIRQTILTLLAQVVPKKTGIFFFLNQQCKFIRSIQYIINFDPESDLPCNWLAGRESEEYYQQGILLNDLRSTGLCSPKMNIPRQTKL